MKSINVLLDSNVRNKYYKSIEYHDHVISEVFRFSNTKNFNPLAYTSTLSIYEEAGLGKLDFLNISLSEDNKNKLAKTEEGSNEEASLLYDFAADCYEKGLKELKSIEKYSRASVIDSLSRKLPHIDNKVLQERFTNDFIVRHNEESSEVLHSFVVFEYLQDKFLHDVESSRRARFLVSLFFHFLPGSRTNSLLRAAHQIWIEDFSEDFLLDNPDSKESFDIIEEKIKLKTRQDFVDGDIVHFAVMGSGYGADKYKFLTITNDPIENVLYRISLYKFTIKNISQIGSSLTVPVIVPDMNPGYIGTFVGNELRWLNVDTIPSIDELTGPESIGQLVSKITRN